MNRTIKSSFRVLGILSIICAVLGLFYSASMLLSGFSGAFEDLVIEKNLLYFYPAFYIMSGTCIIFYLILIFLAVAFVMLKDRFVLLFVAVMVLEVTYFFSIGFFGWQNVELGHSIAAATGVANGGLMFQFLILFPVWASILALWARMKIKKTSHHSLEMTA